MVYGITGIEVVNRGREWNGFFVYEVKWHGEFLCHLTARDKAEAIERGAREAIRQMKKGC